MNTSQVGPAQKLYKEIEAKHAEKIGNGEELTKTEKTNLLDAKIEAYKEMGGKNISFTPGEMKCLYGRWESTGEPQAPGEVRELWQECMSKKGRGEQKESSKRTIMLAALLDPEFGEQFWNQTESVVATMEIKRKLVWLTKQQCLTIYGQEQFDQMVADDSFKTRRDPSNPKFLEYRKRTDRAEGSIQKNQSYGTDGRKKLKSVDEHAELTNNVRQFGIDDEMMDNFVGQGGLHSMAYEAVDNATRMYEVEDDASRVSGQGSTTSNMPPMIARLMKLKGGPQPGANDAGNNDDPASGANGSNKGKGNGKGGRRGTGRKGQKANKIDLDNPTTGVDDKKTGHNKLELLIAIMDTNDTNASSLLYQSNRSKYKPSARMVNDIKNAQATLSSTHKEIHHA